MVERLSLFYYKKNNDTIYVGANNYSPLRIQILEHVLNDVFIQQKTVLNRTPHHGHPECHGRLFL